jgi:hypothetical protein
MNCQSMIVMFMLLDRLRRPRTNPPAPTPAPTPTPQPVTAEPLVSGRENLTNAVLVAAMPRAIAPVAAILVARRADAADAQESRAVRTELQTLDITPTRAETDQTPALRRILQRSAPAAAAAPQPQ